MQCRGISLAQNRQNVHDSCAAPGSLDIAHVARSSIRAFRIGPSIGIRRAGARRLAKRAVTPLGGAAGAPERCRRLELSRYLTNKVFE